MSNNIVFSSTETAHKDWDKLCVHPMQSIEWAKVREKHGIKCVLLESYKDDELEGVFLMTLHKIPYTNYQIGYIPKSEIPSHNILAELKTYSHNNNIIFIKFEPDVSDNKNIHIPTPLTRSSHPIFTKHNQLLSLTKTEDVLLSSLHHKTRYNIRLARKKGVKISEMSNDEGYKIFEKLYFATCERQKYRGHTRKYHRTIWETLGCNNPTTPSNSLISRIFIATYEDIPLAAYQIWFHKNKMYYVYGGSEIYHKEVMAPNLLMWEVILNGKKEGFTTLDMWGSLSKDYDKKDPWAGFTRFKEGYGTEYIEYVGSYDMIINKPVYAIYGLAHKIRQKLI